MKKVILSLSLICFSLTLMFAQVPDKVQMTFKEKYPDATVVKWDADGDRYKVLFTDKERVQNVVVFDRDGKIVRREMEVANVANHPRPIVEYYTKNYPGDKTQRVWVITDESGNKTYYIPREDKIIYFDKDGKFTREEKRELKQKMEKAEDYK